MKTITSISEFERLKPTKTYKAIQKAKNYFKNKIPYEVPFMKDEDQRALEDAKEALKLVKDIEELFLKGE